MAGLTGEGEAESNKESESGEKPKPKGHGTPAQSDETAVAMMAEPRYGTGLPVNRLERLQQRLGGADRVIHAMGRGRGED